MAENRGCFLESWTLTGRPMAARWDSPKRDIPRGQDDLQLRDGLFPVCLQLFGMPKKVTWSNPNFFLFLLHFSVENHFFGQTVNFPSCNAQFWNWTWSERWIVYELSSISFLGNALCPQPQCSTPRDRISSWKYQSLEIWSKGAYH